MAFSDDTNLRFQSVDWNVYNGKGHDHKNIKQLFKKVQDSKKPALLNFKTIIGFGSPNKSAKASSHGSPLGQDEILLTKEKLKWKAKPFEIPSQLLSVWRKSADKNQKVYTQSKKSLKNKNSIKTFEGQIDKLFQSIASDFKSFDTPQATRKSSEEVLNYLHTSMPILGGSADLTGSNNTKGCLLYTSDAADE